MKVNEEGSGVVESTENVAKEARASFDCDRPFQFAIKDGITGMILFSGRVVNPSRN